MRVPIIDKDKNIITTLDVRECDTAGVIFMGSGLARRTFRYNGGLAVPSRQDDGAAFEEVETKTILDPTAQLPVDLELKGAIMVMLPPGQRVSIRLKDSDGEFIISYDYKGNDKLTVWADLPGSECGDEGIIYCEDFGKVDPRVAAKEVAPVPVQAIEDINNGTVPHDKYNCPGCPIH